MKLPYFTIVVDVSVIIAVIGLACILFKFASSIGRVYFLRQYTKKFREFRKLPVHQRRNSQVGDWLVLRSGTLQRELGGWGLGVYGQTGNVPILTNVLSFMREDGAEDHEISAAIDVILRYRGIVANHVWSWLRSALNP